MKRIYESPDIDVGFDADICQHAGGCVKGLPAVFEAGRKPWILPQAAPAEDVAAQVARCPSGALTVERQAG